MDPHRCAQRRAFLARARAELDAVRVELDRIEARYAAMVEALPLLDTGGPPGRTLHSCTLP
jgi:hypothetical protein